MDVIRRITTGTDYKNGMSYFVGQSMVLKDADKKDLHVTIHHIKPNNGGIEIWIESAAAEGSAKEVMIWKSYNSAVPMHIEYNINY